MAFFGFLMIEDLVDEGGVEAATIRYVGGIGSGNYSTIQAAINAANASDTIRVYTGFYNETISISKQLTLIGNGTVNTTINGTGNIVTITANGVTFKYFTISDSGSAYSGSGIYLNNVGTCNIIQNNCSKKNNGIYIYTSDNNIIKQNHCFDNNIGIKEYHASRLSIPSNENELDENNCSFNKNDGINSNQGDSTIKNNICYNNTDCGIEAFGDEFFIYKNVCKFNSRGIKGTNSFTIMGFSTVSIYSNTCNNNKNTGIIGGAYAPIDSNTIKYNKYGASCGGDQSDVYDNIFDGNSIWDLSVSGGDDLDIRRNKFNNNMHIGHTSYVGGNEIDSNTFYSGGIILDNAKGCVFTKNIFNNFGFLIKEIQIFPSWSGKRNYIATSNKINGKSVYYWEEVNNGKIPKGAGQVLLADCKNIEINGTGISNTSWGIQIGHSLNITITNCTFNNNEQDIHFWQSNNSNVDKNNFANGSFGIYFKNSNKNNITNNTFFSKSNYAVCSSSSSNNNKIYHNNFFLNTCYDSCTNQWNDTYPYGGNYWSDYTGVDNLKGPGQNISGSDGIGDTPYNISGGSNKDNYPLMNPTNNFTTVPTPPTNLQTTSGSGYINLTWDIPPFDGGTNITHYCVYRGIKTGDETFLINVSGNFTYYNDSSIANGIIYYYYITAVNKVGESFQSIEITGVFPILPNPPNNLTTTSGDGFVNLSWIQPDNNGGSEILSYRIYRGLASNNSNYLDLVDDKLRFYNDTSVINGINYYYNLTAVNVVGQSNSSNEVNCTPLGISDAPQNLTITAGDKYINITWSEPQDPGGTEIIKYKIYKANQSQAEIFFTSVSGNILFFNDTTVTNGITYYYFITAENCIGESISCDELNATPLGVPGAPQNLNATAGDMYINLTWTKPDHDGGSEIIEYRIYRGNDPGTGIFIGSVSKNTFYYNDTDVMNGKRYYYYVISINIIGKSFISLETDAMPLGLPSAPEQLLANLGNGYIHLNWQPPEDDGGAGILNYYIYCGTNPDNKMFLAKVDSNFNDYNNSDLINGKKYFYQVSAENIVGESKRSMEVNATPVTVPSAPQNLQATSGDSFVKITWSPPLFDGGSPIVNYRIYRDVFPGKEKFLVEIGNLLEFQDMDVINGQTYYYRIIAVNFGVGEGEFSNEVSATPATIPSQTLGLVANSGDSYVNLTWSSPSTNGGYPITNYEIYKGTKLGEEKSIDIVGNVLFYNDTDIIDGFIYYYKVRAKNVMGKGEFSKVTIATPGTTPSAPTINQIISGNSYVKLVWSSPVSDGGFRIMYYNIYRSTTPGNYINIAKVENFTIYMDRDVVNGVIYYYRISAVNKIGEGHLSDSKDTMPMNQPPTVVISANVTEGYCPLNVSFIGLGNDIDGVIDSYRWNFGDGNTSTEQNPLHIFQNDGIFIVTLMVIDNDGAIKAADLYINVSKNDDDLNNSKIKDRDGDGVIDSLDAYPDDPTRWETEILKKKEENYKSAWLWIPFLVLIIIMVILLLLFLKKRTNKNKPRRNDLAYSEDFEDDYVDRDD